MMKFKFGVVLLLAAVCLSACATLNPGPRRENFAPFFIYSEDEKREGIAFDALGPLFTYHRDSQEKDVAFRPFFYSRSEPGRYRLDYLYPMGGYERTERRIHSYFHLVYSTDRDLTAEPTRKKQKSFLLAFWGDTEEGESYGGFFPIYGNLKKRFGRDEMNFVLWPLYSDSRQGESKTYTVLWPIFSYYGGVGREGWKVWPLAGYDRQENDHERTFFLWPIFHFERRNLYTDPTEIEMVWPLYVSSTEPGRVNRSVLWPFFNYQYDQDAKYTQWDFPWPFLQWAEGEERSILRIFPFYGRKVWLGVEKGYILFPIYLYDRDEDETYRTALDRYLLFSKDETRVWKKEGNKAEKKLRVWPFFYYRHDKEGAVFLYWPCIIPIDLEGVEQNWAPLLTLYEYRRDSRGDSESKFLWGIYVHRRNEARELFEFSFFLTYYTSEEVTYFSVLKGLLEYRADRSTHSLRVLYSPWPMEWDSSTAIAGRKEREFNPVQVYSGVNVSGFREGIGSATP